MSTTFVRRDYKRYSKLGKRRKNKQKWRNPTGRHNKMREKRRGYAPTVNIGYKKTRITSGKLNEKNPIIIRNISDLRKLKSEDIVVVAKVGKKKKIEIAKKAKELKIEIYNLNPKKYLKKNEKIKGEKKK
jgi:large subunit ribosomal protein L32e